MSRRGLPSPAPGDALLRRALAGDGASFRLFYRRHLPLIYRYLYFQVGDEEQTRKLAEQVFIRVLALAPEEIPTGRACERWLLRAAGALLLDRERRQTWMAPAWRDREALAARPALARLLAPLSRKERQVTILYFVEEWEPADIGKVVGKGEAGSRAVQYQALNRIRAPERDAAPLNGFERIRAEILSVCLAEMARGAWTQAMSREYYPGWEEEIAELGPLAEAVIAARGARPDPLFVRQSSRRLERRVGPRAPLPDPGFDTVATLRRLLMWRRWLQLGSGNGRPALVLAAAVALFLCSSLLLGTGVVRAADGAVPGDRLYRLDRALEARSLARIADPTVALLQQLAYGQERIEEIAVLSNRGEQALLAEGLSDYGEAVFGASQRLAATGGGADAALTGVVNQALDEQSRALDQILRAGPGAGGGDAPAALLCASGEAAAPETAIATIAGLYGVSAADVGAWRCAGHNFGEIVVALETNRRLDVPVSQLLAYKEAHAGWGQVWQALPTTPGGTEPALFVPPGREEPPPGLRQEPPGQGQQPPGPPQQPPGQGQQPPGQGQEPPGQGQEPPGQGQEPPGQGQEPPGQGQEPPGQGQEPPGQPQPPEPPDQPQPPDPQPPDSPGQRNTPVPPPPPPGRQEPPPGQSQEPPGRPGG